MAESLPPRLMLSSGAAESDAVLAFVAARGCNWTMQLPLSSELRQALSAHPGEPLELLHADSGAAYIVVPRERFETLQALLSATDFNIRETYAAQSRFLGEAGWDDPEMDEYDDELAALQLPPLSSRRLSSQRTSANQSPPAPQRRTRTRSSAAFRG